MKCKRTLAMLIVTILVLNFGTTTAFATERASDYLDSYGITLTAKGAGKMVIAFGVYGTEAMDKIGVYSLEIEEETTPDRWVSNGTIYGSSDTDLFYAYDSWGHMGDYTFYGTRGTRYRVTLTAYAAKGSGNDTATLTCTPTLCT